MSIDLEKARENIDSSALLSDIETLVSALVLIGCFEKADVVMKWEDISRIVACVCEEIEVKIKKVRKELDL